MGGGNPVEFKHMVKGLNRDKFQPWVLFYPSGMRLGIISKWVSTTISMGLLNFYSAYFSLTTAAQKTQHSPWLCMVFINL